VAAVGKGSEDGRELLAIVVARNEVATIGPVLAGLPTTVEGHPLRRLVVDDGSTDQTAAVARANAAEVITHPVGLGLGAALRSGLDLARERGVDAAIYLDGDGEYDPRQAARLLGPILAGRADYVLGSRFLGSRIGMAWHRALFNRWLSQLVGLLTSVHTTDAQTGYRAFSARAVECARIRHDYNSAQVLTLSLWGVGIDPIEVPIDYQRRAHGKSFIRHGEYLRRVAPALLAEWRESRLRRRAPER